jgi:Protein of unknown function (DUF1565)/Pectinesterase
MRGMFKRSRGARAMWRFAAAMLLVALAAGLTAGAAAAKMPKVEVRIVSQAPPPETIPANTAYYSTIQEAVNASTKDNWILIEPGVYYEQVKVTHKHHDIWIRGMDRNGVILDGQNKPGNGIEVYKTNNVYIENLTVRNYDTGCGDDCGNGIWWNGGGDKNHVKNHGWWGRYLTSYNTGLGGGYGIFTNNEIHGEWDHVYASGWNDSGMYLGACQECDAEINHMTMENNALGYSGSNSGGKLIIENSVIAHNSTGIAPNGENPGDGPPPQDGECGRQNIRHPNPTPTITSTEIARCTIIRKNLITENSNLNAPDNGSSGAAPWGAGVELPGDYADAIEENTITNNPSNGVLGFEYPNPFPPQSNTIYFQLAGNKIANNTFSGNGYLNMSYSGDVTLQGGLFGSMQSVNNCVSGNTFADAVYPANIEGEWGCQNSTTPNPNNGGGAINYLLELQAQSESRTPEPQPAPPAQETMPEPCKGVPTDPLCP